MERKNKTPSIGIQQILPSFPSNYSSPFIAFHWRKGRNPPSKPRVSVPRCRLGLAFRGCLLKFSRWVHISQKFVILKTLHEAINQRIQNPNKTQVPIWSECNDSFPLVQKYYNLTSPSISSEFNFAKRVIEKKGVFVFFWLPFCSVCCERRKNVALCPRPPRREGRENGLVDPS